MTNNPSIRTSIQFHGRTVCLEKKGGEDEDKEAVKKFEETMGDIMDDYLMAFSLERLERLERLKELKP